MLFQYPFYKRFEESGALPDSSGPRSLVVVSNRLPVTFHSDGSLGLSSGGLVTAMTPVLKKKGGIWLGWPGTDGEVGKQLQKFSQNNPYSLKGVALGQEEIEKFYYGFSNQVLWPLFHGLPEKCRFDVDCWETYRQVNKKFAARIRDVAHKNDYIWVQDYHLICVAQELKESGVKRKSGFYLHTPFPSPENFFKLPWREVLLDALLQYQLIGFQTSWDLDNFCRCLEYYNKDTRTRDLGRCRMIRCGSARCKAGVFPISIDFQEFSGQDDFRISRPAPQTVNNDDNPNGLQWILGIDRLDYSKGIPDRLQAFETALKTYPELRGRISLMQVVVPSRENIEEYRQLKNEIEHRVGGINGRWSTPDWTPILYMHRSLNRDELLAAYQSADIALITPLRDGMNLVAKEYCASKNDGNGVLILSEFAGASLQLKEGALLVNPHNLDEVAEAIHRAFHLSYPQRSRLMEKARKNIQQEDVHWWLDRYLEAVWSDVHSQDAPKPNMHHYHRLLKNGLLGNKGSRATTR